MKPKRFIFLILISIVLLQFSPSVFAKERKTGLYLKGSLPFLAGQIFTTDKGAYGYDLFEIGLGYDLFDHLSVNVSYAFTRFSTDIYNDLTLDKLLARGTYYFFGKSWIAPYVHVGMGLGVALGDSQPKVAAFGGGVAVFPLQKIGIDFRVEDNYYWTATSVDDFNTIKAAVLVRYTF